MTFAAAIFAATVCALPQPTQFSGKPDTGVYVDVPESTAFTASIWVNANTAGADDSPYPRIVQLPCGYLHLFREGVVSDTASLLLGLSVPKDAVPRGVSSWQYAESVPLKRWVHVAIVCRASSEIVPEVYVNGQRIANRVYPKPLPARFNGGKATLGNVTVGGNRPFDGLLADFRFEPHALSAEEIAVLARTAPDGNPPRPYVRTFHDELPIVDLSHDMSRQVVISSGADGVYQGHPTTVVAPDGTIYCVWTINHGGSCGPMAKSADGGRTWTRCDDIMPVGYKEHRNCPTLQTIIRPDGGTNLVVFSAKKGGCGIVISPDGGKSWWEAPTAKLSAGMPPTGFMMLKDGSAALFGQVFKAKDKARDRPTDDQAVWMSISKDGGWTWGPMSIVAAAPQKNLCEPFCIRSPDGGELCLLMRENRHTARSMMCFSRDEGKTWTTPVDTCWGLTGDRHEGIYLPDGRLFIAFRDRALGSSTSGQYVAWVGSYADLSAGKGGDCRVHLLDHVGENVWDTGYSGVELLDDGTILCTTYMQYRATDKAHSVVCMRLTLADMTSCKKCPTRKEKP